MDINRTVEYLKSRLKVPPETIRNWNRFMEDVLEYSLCETPALPESFSVLFWAETGPFLKKLNKTLKKCTGTVHVNWDRDFLNFVIYYAFEEENNKTEDLLDAASAFLLLNASKTDARRRISFHEGVYGKILLVLKGQEDCGEQFVDCLRNLATFLRVFKLPKKSYAHTVNVLQPFTYYTNHTLSDFDLTMTSNYRMNIGNLAFCCLRFLVLEAFNDTSKGADKLLTITKSLCSSLTSKEQSSHRKSTIKLHQRNVITFFNQHLEYVSTRERCILTVLIKSLLLDPSYNDTDGIGALIEILPRESRMAIFNFVGNLSSFTCTDAKLNVLNYMPVLVELTHKTLPKESDKTLLTKYLNEISKLALDKNGLVRENSLIALENVINRKRCREDDILEFFASCPIITVLDDYSNILDVTWKKRTVNVTFIKLFCSVFLSENVYLHNIVLKNFEAIISSAPASYLKVCLPQLKQVLKKRGPSNEELAVCILSMYVNNMLKSSESSAAVYVEDLYELIFEHIKPSPNNEDVNNWAVVTYLQTDRSFDLRPIMEKFIQSKKPLHKHVRNIIEYKIHEPPYDLPALRLLPSILKFVPYSEWYVLEEKLVRIVQDVKGPQRLIPVAAALKEILKHKKLDECSFNEINHFKQLQDFIQGSIRTFKIPSDTLVDVAILLKPLAVLTGDECISTCLNRELDRLLVEKVKDLKATNLQHHTVFTKVCSYIGTLSVLFQLDVPDDRIDSLQNLLDPWKQTAAFKEYLKKNRVIWLSSVLLYIKLSFTRQHFISQCPQILERIFNISHDTVLQVQAVMALYDICQHRFKDFDTLVPVLFKFLHHPNGKCRYFSFLIITCLLQKEQLKLSSAQYALFASLVVDDSEVVRKRAQNYLQENLLQSNRNIIAGSFVASILHYNLCTTHPLHQLHSVEKEIIERRMNLIDNNKIEIYRFLLKLLSRDVQLNVIRQINEDILATILHKQWKDNIDSIIEDCLSIILLLELEKNLVIEDLVEYYKKNITRFRVALFEGESKEIDEKITNIGWIEKVLSVLFRLLFIDGGKRVNYNNIYFTIMVLTDLFSNQVKALIVNEGNTTLTKNYAKMFQEFNEEDFSTESTTVYSNVHRIWMQELQQVHII